jgi:hypothetical protein
MKRFKCIFLDGVTQETRLQYSQLISNIAVTVSLQQKFL